MLRRTPAFLRHFRRDTRGATAIEYGLIVAAIAAAVIGLVNSIGLSVLSFYESVQAGFDAL